ncbi:MAG: hypothetical protein NT096_00210 [Proteobacteria bacterium]|nr:hypothetical protein [Pseudomonadota bacterium]
MSTSYTRFKKPITKINIETKGPHDKVTVWVNHQNAGTLVVDKGTGKEFLEMFNSDEQVLHCYAGPTGPCVMKDDPNISDDEYIISEYLDVVTVGEVLKGRTLVHTQY